MHLQRFAAALFVSILLIVAPLPGSAQVRRAAKPRPAGPIRERDIRAELGFLASDALQGRGSGTNNERLAAEYIGSQFRQFGLEPAGEIGYDGKPSFVRTVTIRRRGFADKPCVKVG